MKNKTTFLKLRLFLAVIFLFLAVAVISTGCTCPLFSLFERLTGIEVKTGKNIDKSLVASELIYPDSAVLLQAEGDINKIMELADKYGVTLSEKDLAALDELPQEIKDQEISATIYSTADNKSEVLDYYDSFNEKDWDILEVQNEGQADNEGQPVMLLASDGSKQQTLILVDTPNNTFIIFVDFDWGALTEMGN